MLQILSPSDNLGSWYISSLQFSLTQLYESLGVSYCTSEHYLLYSSEKRRHLFEVPNDQYQRKQWQSTPVLLPGKSHGGGAWQAAIHGVAKSWTRLNNFTFTFHFHALEKEMATHPSILAWRIPGTGKPGGQLSMGSHRVGHD